MCRRPGGGTDRLRRGLGGTCSLSLAFGISSLQPTVIGCHVSHMARRRATSPRPVNWRRLAIATFAFYFGLAAIILVVFEVVLPMIGSDSASSTSRFNYGSIFSTSFARPFGWILAAVVLLLAPLTLLVRSSDDLGDRLADWVRGGKS
jgi:hypothetical protein